MDSVKKPVKVKAMAFIDEPNKKHIRKDIEEKPEAFVKKLLKGSKFNFGVMEVMSHGWYKEQGYVYDLRPFLRHFVVKQYGSWQEMYALDKTNVRELAGRVTKIVEITK